MADAPRNTTSMNTTISEVRSIAEAAINSINQLTNLIEVRISTSTPTELQEQATRLFCQLQDQQLNHCYLTKQPLLTFKVGKVVR